MSYERLIHDYLDEGLPEVEQETLFNELAKNSEMRSEFNKQLKIQQMARENFENIAPPLELTNRVFSIAGFSSPYAYVQGFRFSYLFALIPLVFLTYGIANYDGIKSYLSGNKGIVESVKLTKQVNGKFASQSRVSVLTSNSLINVALKDEKVNKMDKLNNEANSSNNKLINKPNSRSINSHLESKIKNISNENLNTSNVNKSEEIKALNINNNESLFFSLAPSKLSSNIEHKSINSNNIAGNIVVQNFILSNEPIMTSDYIISPDHTRFSFSVRAINNSSLYKSESFNNIPIANYAVDVAYKLDNNWAVFAEYSRENYYQDFKNITEDGLMFQTMQNPNYMVLTLGARYMAKDLFNSYKIYPFIQAGAGYTSVGAVAKMMMGLEIRVTNNLSFVPSFDLSSLVYQNQLGTYSSWNNGFSLGLNYNFWE